MTAVLMHPAEVGFFQDPRQTGGSGPEADFLSQRRIEITERFLRTPSVAEIYEPFDEWFASVLDEMRRDDTRLRLRTLFHARWVAMQLPISVPPPQVEVDDDGEIAFEWYRDDHWNFSVSVGPRGTLSYAGLFGETTAYGTERISDEFPENISRNLVRLFEEARG
jgi:hypothetical protein